MLGWGVSEKLNLGGSVSHEAQVDKRKIFSQNLNFAPSTFISWMATNLVPNHFTSGSITKKAIHTCSLEVWQLKNMNFPCIKHMSIFMNKTTTMKNDFHKNYWKSIEKIYCNNANKLHVKILAQLLGELLYALLLRQACSSWLLEPKHFSYCTLLPQVSIVVLGNFRNFKPDILFNLQG